MKKGTPILPTLFTQEGRNLLCKQKNLLPVANGFADNEGIVITDEEMLSLLIATHQPALNDAVTLNDLAEAFLDEFITRINKQRDPVVLLRKAAELRADLKGQREKTGRPVPKLNG